MENDGFNGSSPETIKENKDEVSVVSLLSSNTIKESTTFKPELICQASSSVLINIFFFACILARPTLRKRKVHHLFLNVSLVHILNGIAVIVSNVHTKEDHKIFVIINDGFSIEIFESMLLLTCERVVALKFHFKYSEVKRRHILILIICSSIKPIIYVTMAILYDVTEEANLIVSSITILISAILLCSSNAIIYGIAKEHQRFLNISSTSGNQIDKKKDTLKASFVCLAVVLSFILLWAPSLVHNILILSSDRMGSNTFGKVADHIAYLHGIVDPILFIWLSASTKKELMKIFKLFS